MKKLFWLSTLLLIACETVPTNHAAKPHDRRTPEIIASDKAIEQAAIEEFRDDADVQQQSHIAIDVYNGLALITGEVLEPNLKSKIIDAVRIIPNVKMVRDSLDVAPLSTPEQHAADTELARQVTEALKQIQTLPSFDSSMVKVVCEDGMVYLMGLVSKEEGEVVVKVTRLQPNVKQIVTVFEYVN